MDRGVVQMTREERIALAMKVVEREHPKEFRERSWFARPRPAEKRSEIYERDWTGSSAGGRIWAGSRQQGGREL